MAAIFKRKPAPKRSHSNEAFVQQWSATTTKRHRPDVDSPRPLSASERYRPEPMPGTVRNLSPASLTRVDKYKKLLSCIDELGYEFKLTGLMSLITAWRSKQNRATDILR